MCGGWRKACVLGVSFHQVGARGQTQTSARTEKPCTRRTRVLLSPSGALQWTEYGRVSHLSPLLTSQPVYLR